MLENKQGIAPIIATIMLLGFAVVFGIVIMSFGRAQVQLESKCAADIGLKFSEIGGKPDICMDRTKDIIKFTVENGANSDVTGLMVNIIGTEQAESFTLDDAKVSKAGIYLTDLGYNIGTNGEIRQVKIIPKITPFDEEVICSEQALVIEKVADC